MLRGQQRCFHHSINLWGKTDGGCCRHRLVTPVVGDLYPAARMCSTPTTLSFKRGGTRTRQDPTSTKTTRFRARLFSTKGTVIGRIPPATSSNTRQQGMLSRTDRRSMERKERNRIWRNEMKKKKNSDLSKQQDNASDAGRTHGYSDEAGIVRSAGKVQRGPTAATGSRVATTTTTTTIPPVLLRLLRSLTPRVPGRDQRAFRWEEIKALAYRLPLLFAITYAVTDENISPYVIQASLGPSMIPTIQFVGDIWLVETGAWRRAWRKLVSMLLLWQNQDPGDVMSSSSSPLDYKVGDLVLWKDPKLGWVSCKRIVGCQGDVVQRYGQYAPLYRSRRDWGIVWPRDAGSRSLDPSCAWDTTKRTTTTSGPFLSGGGGVHSDTESASDDNDQEIARTLTVPNNFVWIEGDNCLFSVDSRQYGPIPTSWICGRLVFRLWPWKREELIGDTQHSYLSSCWVSPRRPVPYPTVDQYLGRRFNFYKV